MVQKVGRCVGKRFFDKKSFRECEISSDVGREATLDFHDWFKILPLAQTSRQLVKRPKLLLFAGLGLVVSPWWQPLAIGALAEVLTIQVNPQDWLGYLSDAQFLVARMHGCESWEQIGKT